jgi:hypothetical protein
MLRSSLFSRHSARRLRNSSELAHSGSLLVAMMRATMDSRLRGNDDGVLGSVVRNIRK